MVLKRLKCPKCGNIIEIEYTGEKDQRVVCNKCDSRFILRDKPKEEYEKIEEPFKRDPRKNEEKSKFFSDLGDPYNLINIRENENKVERKIPEKQKMSVSNFEIFMHIFAVLAFIAFLTAYDVRTPTITQQAVQGLWQIKYILFIILFEIMALYRRILG